MHRLTLLGLVAAALTLSACGKKPVPQAPPAVPAAQPDRGPSVAQPDDGGVPLVTAGGISLADAPEAVARAAAALATRPDTATRELIALGETAAPVAVALLASKNLNEIEAALAFLRDVTHPDAVGPITTLLSHDAATVRDAARRTLARYEGVGLAAGVIPLLSSEVPALRVDAARALARIGGEDARDALVKRLTDTDDAVLLEVVTAIGRVASPIPQEAIDALAAADARPAQLRAGLILARRLGQVAPTSAIERGLSASDLGTVTDAARAISVAPAADRERLVAAAWESSRLDTRRALLEGLVASGHPPLRARADALARAAIADPDPALRAVGVDALGNLIPAPTAAAATDDAALDPIAELLLPLLDDPSPQVRRVAAARLAEATPLPPVVARLDARLGDEPDAGTRQVIISALARIGDRDAIGRLIGRLGDEELGPLCHLALLRLSGEQHAREAGAWTAWLDQTLSGAPTPPPAPTGADTPGAPASGDAPEAPRPEPEPPGVPG